MCWSCSEISLYLWTVGLNFICKGFSLCFPWYKPQRAMMDVGGEWPCLYLSYRSPGWFLSFPILRKAKKKKKKMFSVFTVAFFCLIFFTFDSKKKHFSSGSRLTTERREKLSVSQASCGQFLSCSWGPSLVLPFFRALFQSVHMWFHLSIESRKTSSV